MKLALDAMGGDAAPGINVAGAKLALADFPEIKKIYLVGDESSLKKECDVMGLRGDRVEIVHASEVVEMSESGIMAVRQKKNSSISVAVDMVKTGDAQAVISAGNTGAAVAASTIKLRLLKGVERAGIASPLPNTYGYCNLLDAGANPEARPSHLVGYAIMGSVFARTVFQVKEPVVGIMSNGEEDEKGTAFTKETFALLRRLSEEGRLPFKFRGNVEGHDLFDTRLDVVLTDGFTGNVLLKTCEATFKAMSKWLKQELMANPVRKMGALISKGAFQALKMRASYEATGGCPLLGVNGVSIISHGGSNDVAMRNALRVAKEMVGYGVNPLIEEAFAKLGNIES